MRLLWRLLGYFKPYLAQMAAASILLASAGGLMSAVVAALKPLTDQVLEGATGSTAPTSDGGANILDAFVDRVPVEGWADWLRGNPFAAVPILLVSVYFVRSVFLYFGQYLSTRAGASIIRDLRAELYERIAYQSQRFFQEHSTGLILSRVLNDVQRIQNLTTKVLADLVRVGASVPFILIVIFLHDWRLSLLSMAVIPALGYPMVRLGKRLRRAATRSQETMADAAGLMTETVQGAKVVQGFAMEPFEIARFREAIDRNLRADVKAGRASAMATALIELVGAIAGAALFYFAGRAIAAGAVGAGDFVVVLSGLGLLAMSFRRLNAVNLDIQRSLAAAARIFDMLDHEREIRDAPDATPLPPFGEEIRFHGVGFAYDDRRVVDGIDLSVRRGEVVALVGASGSGKSTIANLVARFWDPTEGHITVDGRDLRKVTLRSLRSQIGLVTQETILFDETVRNNIAYGRADVSLARVRAAARAAHADEFVTRMPDGYDTILGERGARLSMGQRQRISIARALLKDPPILILDEATSALDAESEALVQHALENLMAGRTSIVIAHRLATVRRADRIVVLDGGRIVEQGTHPDLLERGGVYARHYDLQFRED
jgi:subfamily B ATP-binding cassette protein MsbA